MEENEIRELYYNEAMRFYGQAKDTLVLANIKDNGFYSDKKYVKMACGIAYSGVLIALDGYLRVRGIELEEKMDIDFYRGKLVHLDRNLFDIINSVYSALHLSGYYDGTTDSEIVKTGFKRAKEIMDYIKPIDN
jgi:hypothetical protein